MAKQKVSITDNGIKSGVTSDEKRAICEYIWNGFLLSPTRVPNNSSVLLIGVAVNAKND